MESNISIAYRMATGLVIMMFVISIGITIMLAGRQFLNKSLDNIEAPMTAMADTDIYYLSAYGGAGEHSGYGSPVPVANIFRWCLNNDNEMNIEKFTLYERSGTGNPNDWVAAYMFEKVLSTDCLNSRDVLSPFMDQKAYISWERDTATDFYTMEVYID